MLREVAFAIDPTYSACPVMDFQHSSSPMHPVQLKLHKPSYKELNLPLPCHSLRNKPSKSAANNDTVVDSMTSTITQALKLANPTVTTKTDDTNGTEISKVVDLCIRIENPPNTRICSQCDQIFTRLTDIDCYAYDVQNQKESKQVILLHSNTLIDDGIGQQLTKLIKQVSHGH